ncbi:MAG: sulfatase [Saprospiraceae bacterium]|nr:sulfatase [Saprospiraceae bacterium]
MNQPPVFLRIACVFMLIATMTSCGEQAEAPPPNIVFILADDLGWADLPVYGNRFNEAPNLTRLAEEGMTFDNAYAACPVCSPTRASIQTGQYPARLGIIDFLPGHWRPFEKMQVAQNRTQYLPLQMETLGEMMKKANYRTGYFGKWHLGNQEQNFPKNQGYDESVIFQGSPYYNYNQVLKPNQSFPEDKILSEALTDLSVSFIEDNKDDPFFLFLAHYDVHVQLDADTNLIKQFLNKPNVNDYPCNAIYAAMIKHIDNSVGRIVDKINELALEENTIIIFYSDNGGLVSRFDKIPLIADSKKHYYPEDSLLYIASSNQPLRAEKGTLYEGGIREPLIVKWPNKINPGSSANSPISSVDFFPTLMEITHGMPPDQTLDGKSMLPILTGKEDLGRTLFWHYPVYHHSRPASAIREGNFKLLYFYDEDQVELYNLNSDIGEKNNLAAADHTRAKELKAKLDTWLKDVGADLPVINPDFDESRRYEWGKHPGREALQKGE